MPFGTLSCTNLFTQIEDQKRAKVVKQIFMPYVPVDDEAKTEIISLSAGKSVDMTDINHGHNIVN